METYQRLPIQRQRRMTERLYGSTLFNPGTGKKLRDPAVAAERPDGLAVLPRGQRERSPRISTKVFVDNYDGFRRLHS